MADRSGRSAAKTKLCRFLRSGCRNGSGCPFAHETQELRANPKSLDSDAVVRLTPLLGLLSPAVRKAWLSDPELVQLQGSSNTATGTGQAEQALQAGRGNGLSACAEPKATHSRMVASSPALPGPVAIAGFPHSNGFWSQHQELAHVSNSLDVDLIGWPGISAGQAPWTTFGEQGQTPRSAPAPPMTPMLFLFDHPPPAACLAASPASDMIELDRLLRAAADIVYED